MKALVYQLVITFPFNPEDCKPYDGVEFETIFKPVDTDIEAFEEELNEEIAQSEFGIASFTADGEIELEDEEYINFEDQIISKEDYEIAQLMPA